MKSKWYKSWRLLLISIFSGIILFFILANLTPSKTNTENTQEPTNAENSTALNNNSDSEPTEAKYSFEIIDRSESKTIENYMVLIDEGDDGEAIAMEVKKKCRKPCNIDIYDDRSALTLQKEYDAMMGTSGTTLQDLELWKKDNYIFVADHYVGQIYYETGGYKDHPYWDFYYRELKGI